MKKYILHKEELDGLDYTGKFTHLHLHTTGSIADSMIKPEELAKRVAELKMTSVAKTDHGNMFKTVPFYQACKREKIKPIIGMETYVAPRRNTLKTPDDSANYHLVLLAENNVGYKNLMDISSDAAINGFYYRARTDKFKLREKSEGIIALSACLGGEVQKLLIQGNFNGALAVAKEYDEIFGRGNFFLEMQDHGIPEQQAARDGVKRISEMTGIPLVATNDSHYVYAEDFVAHDVLMAIQSKKLVDDEDRMKYESDQFYIKSPEEMYELFKGDEVALYNTYLIGERCNVTLDFDSIKLPPFKIPDNFRTNREYLEYLLEIGMKNRYGDKAGEEHYERMAYEVDVIDRMGYINYFLITWDFFRFCQDGTLNPDDEKSPDWEPILTGPGRGSAAGSIVAYLLGITEICPLEYGLMFERFLDPSRVSMPDYQTIVEPCGDIWCLAC